MRIESCLLLALVITLSIALPSPPAQSMTACFLNNMAVQYPAAVGANQTFTISTSFSVSCSGNNTRLVKVELFDGVDGSLLSSAILNRTSSTVVLRNMVRAPIVSGYWRVTGQASVVNAATYGATGWGLRIFINPAPIQYPWSHYNNTNATECHGKHCRT